jgi:hypothetical protein
MTVAGTRNGSEDVESCVWYDVGNVGFMDNPGDIDVDRSADG